ncbi:MAG: M23 family metallopeptidase [Candidatus Dadabacteria bacterium]|nr:MAG: M23 family metallopeptidase [Candidatus Dadabacteria bacterium]
MALGVVLLAASPAFSAPEPVTAAIPPGQLIRWEGPFAACKQETETWAPLPDGSCLFAVDLLERASELEIRAITDDTDRIARLLVLDYPWPVQRITLKDDRHVHLSEADLARVQRENARIRALWKLNTPRRWHLPLHPPLADLPHGGRFGSRRFINGEPRNPHSGADYPAAEGTPVLAADDGTVVLAEEHFFAGNSIFIDHGDGLISMYFHLSRIDVQPGQSVERGQVIGAVGATGRATGPHLHFGIRWKGRRIDPADFLTPPADLPAIMAAPLLAEPLRGVSAATRAQ